MASGGEGIIPPDVMGALDDPAASTPEGAMEIVQMLRDIMDFAPGPRGPEASEEDMNAQTGMRIPTNQSRVGGFSLGDPGTVSQFGNVPNASVTSGATPSFELQGSSGLGGNDPLQLPGRDFRHEIGMAQASVDNLRALAIRDGNRNTSLRNQLLPEAENRLNQLKIEFDQQQQVENLAIQQQGIADQGAAQLLNAQQAPELARIEAQGRVDAAQAGRGSFDDSISDPGPAPAQAAPAPAQAAPTMDPAQAQLIEAAQAGDPGAIAQAYVGGLLTDEDLNRLEQTNPDIAQQVRVQLALIQGQ
jgi:hypothetical protein